MNRRDFVRSAALASIASFASAPAAARAADPPAARKSATNKNTAPFADRICLFTDHLDDFGYSYREVAAMLKQLGMTGPDLTVRPGGLVLPEKVAEDLPKAVTAFRDASLSVPMISTGLTTADDAAAKATLTTAAQLGIRYYKLGYYSYSDAANWRTELEATRKKLEGLMQINRRLGMVAGFHNHAGANIGGALWDSWELLDGLDPGAIGFYFDPAQATIEGGNHAWKLNFLRIAPRLAMVAIKDFVWEKNDGRWRTRWVPLGEGMVRWNEFLPLLVRIPFDGPISLHIEYDPGGNTKADRFEKSLAAAERDLKFLRSQLHEAQAATNTKK
jgi:sugar phosphate isomerase/epimerase